MLPYVLGAIFLGAIFLGARPRGKKRVNMRALGYRNGTAFPIVLEAITDRHLLAIDAARAFRAMRDAASLDGISLIVNSAFRTMAEQTMLFNLSPGERERYGVGKTVAKPGYSNHQSGVAVDIQTSRDARVSPWLIANAARFGFKNTISSEPWHWEFLS